MALTQTIQVTGNGFIVSNGTNHPVANISTTYDDCYIKVAEITANKTEGQAVVVFTKEANNSILFERSFLFPINLVGDNFIKQAYEHLKTLPEFANATDC